MTYETKISIVVMLLAILSAPLTAQEAPERAPAAHDEGRAYAEQLADAGDLDRNGTIEEGEMLTFAEMVFGTVDANRNGTMSEMEMAEWRYGMGRLAAFRDREQAYRTSIALVFDIFDRDDDGQVDREEHIDAITRSASYADLDGNGRLDRHEYLSGFIFNVAMRAALVTEDMQ